MIASKIPPQNGAKLANCRYHNCFKMSSFLKICFKARGESWHGFAQNLHFISCCRHPLITEHILFCHVTNRRVGVQNVFYDLSLLQTIRARCGARTVERRRTACCTTRTPCAPTSAPSLLASCSSGSSSNPWSGTTSRISRYSTTRKVSW